MFTCRALMLSGVLLAVVGFAGRARSADWEPVKDTPTHLQFAVQAAALKIAGMPPGKLPVDFSPAALGAVQRLAVKPAGFTLLRAALYSVSRTKKGRLPRYAASGALAYLSPLGQRAVVAYTLLYALQPHRLRIEFASFAPVVAKKPIVMMYLLPATVRAPDQPGLDTLLGQIAEHAYDLHKLPELPDGDYLLAGVVFDWLPDAIPMELWISDKDKGLDPPLDRTTPANFNGWRVYLRHVTLKLKEHPKYYAKFAWTNGANSLIASEPITRPGGSAEKPSTDFDGTWTMTQTCAPVGATLGYTNRFVVNVTNGAFHGEGGIRDQPGWITVDGKISSDGAVAIKAGGLIGGDPARLAGNAPIGSRFAYDAQGRISGTSGTGKRLSGRACDWAFVKRVATPGTIADISGDWSTADGRIVAVKQNGDKVNWTSCCKPGHEDLVVEITGRFDGKTVVGNYHYRENQAEGRGTVTYTLNGERLEGTWKSPDGKRSFTAMLIRHTSTSPRGIGGKWTTVSGHTVTLTQNGNEVRWTTCCRQSHPNWRADISATFDGQNLVGLYHWRDGDQQGNGTVSYTLHGNELHGMLERRGKEPYHSVLTRQLGSDNALAGGWRLDDGRRIQIKQTGNQVSWDVHGGAGHESRVGTVSCVFDGKELVGIYQFTEGTGTGRGTVHMTFDGDRLSGMLSSLDPPGQTRHTVITRQ
jgi:hypothetical protein